MEVKNLTAAEFDSVIGADEVTVVDFWADWCGPCMMLGPIMEDVAKEMSDVRFYKINVDSDPAPAMRFGIDAIPCVMFFRGGQLLGQSVGLVNKDTMIARISAVLK